jgi:polyhydroxyalkanoate synthesis repressor PhaR
MLVKKYGNRRLYDTDASRYITMEELTQKIRAGTDVQIIDAKSGEDLTQATLTQAIVEGRNASGYLPVPLLHQLLRLGDDALAEFFNRYVSAALEIYLQAKSGAQALGPFNPFAALNPLASALMRPFAGAQQAPAPPAPNSDVEALRREMDELKRSLRKRKK